MTDPEGQQQPSEITLEEWIASCQSCCGIEPESSPMPQADLDNPMESESRSQEQSNVN
jgi:hypothetical protein